MKPLQLTHVGVLVADLESTRRRWSAALGLPFSPISRYQPDAWSDRVTPEPHEQSARLTFCLGADPSFEILEFVGVGTHSPTKGEGGHHLSFPPLEDNAARRDELAALGVGTDGSIEHDGRLIFMFGESGPLDNVYTEWVEESDAHNDIKDDGSPIGRLPDGSKTLFAPEQLEAVDGVRPWSGVTEVEVGVTSLEHSVPMWRSVTGYEFLKPARGATTVVSEPVGRTALRLCELDGRDHQRLGVNGAVIEVGDLGPTAQRLERDGVPFSRPNRYEIVIDAAFLNDFTVRYRVGAPGQR